MSVETPENVIILRPCNCSRGHKSEGTEGTKVHESASRGDESAIRGFLSVL
jgi:hypothetical protein